jgi:hypothetical protein
MIILSFPDSFPFALFYTILVGENDPHIRVLSGFMGSGGGKIGGKKQLDLNALTSQ